MATLDELAEREEARRRRQGILQQTIVDDRIARIGNNMRPEAAAVLGDSRKLTTQRINGRDYLVNEDGAITTGVNFNRPLTDEEYRRLGTAGAAKEIYAPENRIQGVGYAESRLITDEDMANIRRERTLKAAGTESIRDSARAVNLKRRLQEAIRADSDPSAAQLEAKKRWDLTRALGGTRGAQKQAALMLARTPEGSGVIAPNGDSLQLALAQMKYKQELELQKLKDAGALALEQAKQAGNLSNTKQLGLNATDLERLKNEGLVASNRVTGENTLANTKQLGLNATDLERLKNAGSLAVAQAEGLSAQEVERLKNAGTLAVAQAQGLSAQEVARLQNEGNLAVAQREAQNALDVAALQNQGNLSVAQLQGQNALTLEQAKQAGTLSNTKQLGQNATDLERLKNEGTLAVTRQTGADNLAVAQQEGANSYAVTQQKTLSDQEIARLQNANRLAVAQREAQNALDVAALQNQGRLAVARQQGADALTVAKQEGADKLAVAKQQGADKLAIEQLGPAAANRVAEIEKRSNDIIALATRIGKTGPSDPANALIARSMINSMDLTEEEKKQYLDSLNGGQLIPVVNALIADANRLRAQIGYPEIVLEAQPASNAQPAPEDSDLIL